MNRLTSNDLPALSTFSAIRYSPEIRSAYIERFEDGPDVLTLYGKALYLDPTLLGNSSKTYVYMSVPQVCLLMLKTGPTHVEVPEPLWTRKMPQTLALLIFAHLAGAMRLRRTLTSTYCIENEDPGRIARVTDMVPRGIRASVLRLPLAVFGVLIRRWVFGTAASRDTYAGVLGPAWSFVRNRSTLVWPLPSPCRCSTTSAKGGRKVLFVGALTSRKGVPELMSAWEELQRRGSSLTLSILGDGDLFDLVHGWADGKESVKLRRSPTREEIHAELRAASAVVLLSKPERYWREQIGLPLLEGLAHGCRLVTTTQTGIAAWLASNGHVVIDDPQDSALVADAIAAATAAGEWSTQQLPKVNGRAAAASVMHS